MVVHIPFYPIMYLSLLFILFYVQLIAEEKSIYRNPELPVMLFVPVCSFVIQVRLEIFFFKLF